jgi:glutamine synthetase
MVKVPCFSEKEEFVKFVVDNSFRILNLCHVPEDGRLKTLSFAAADRDRVLEVLEFGERVDGSSLFSFIEPGRSDIYIVPRVSRAFMNPFASVPTLNVLCDYLDETGKPLDVAPRNVLAKAERKLKDDAGVALKGLAELEYYVVAKQDNAAPFEGLPDRNYHDSAPFARFEALRNETLVVLTEAGISTKYAHGEVGRIFGKDGSFVEQHEVEFAVQSLADMADNVAVAKWVLRNLCVNHGVSVTFVPKVSLEHAGTGMHVHLCALKSGRNVVAGADGGLSDEAKMMIGGILRFAPSLGAFGNPTPVSYLRFIARKESPMHICWASRNRLALVRIPLWWSFKKGKVDSLRETFEYRAPDAFANAYLLFAGLVLAADYGLSNGREMLKEAEELHIEAGSGEQKKLEVLPCCCSESANNLEKDRGLYEVDGVFPKRLIDKTMEKLRSYKDDGLKKTVADNPDEVEKLIQQYWHYG